MVEPTHFKRICKSQIGTSPQKNGVQQKTHLSCHHRNAESETKRIVFLVLPFSVLDPYWGVHGQTKIQSGQDHCGNQVNVHRLWPSSHLTRYIICQAVFLHPPPPLHIWRSRHAFSLLSRPLEPRLLNRNMLCNMFFWGHGHDGWCTSRG